MPGKRNNQQPKQKKQQTGKGTVKQQPRTTRLVANSSVVSTRNNVSVGRPISDQTTRIRGKDYLRKLTLKAKPTTAADRILATFPITPSGYAGTRVTQLSPLWERYRFDAAFARFVTSLPTSVSCQLCMYIDTDPSDDPLIITDVEALVRQAVTAAGSRVWNASASQSVPLVVRRDGQLYYTGNTKENVRLTQSGVGYLIQVTNPLNALGAPLEADLEAGSLYLDWDVTFSTPQIEPAAVVAAPRVPKIEVVSNTIETAHDEWTLVATVADEEMCFVAPYELHSYAVSDTSTIRLDLRITRSTGDEDIGYARNIAKELGTTVLGTFSPSVTAEFDILTPTRIITGPCEVRAKASSEEFLEVVRLSVVKVRAV